ncbi:MAG: hypothetical protein M1816_006432 [Peltula sp. TS41687]|nr:MAG: hypothetical protein M1816_006432 [Peltula sp. TS41687]
MSMITATAWVPRGFPARHPTKYDFDETEFDRIAELAKLQLDEAKEDLEEARSGLKPADQTDDENSDDNGVPVATGSSKEVDDDDLKEYNLEDYDNESDGDDQGTTMSMFGNAKSLAYYDSNKDDPYITIQEEDKDDEDREELEILPTDNLLLAAKVEDEVAHLEVYVYEDEADNLYVHHDIMLPAIPLCIEWIDIRVGKEDVDTNSKANFVAVGTFDPDIEIWDLDTVDCLYPNAILGQGGEAGHLDRPDSAQKKKKNRKKTKKANEQYHVDAILSLAANRQHRNLLASSSADQTVKLWDLNTKTCAKSYAYHTDKACSIAWHPKMSTVLLSGSYDRTVVAADMRAPDAQVPRWGVESDVEEVRWDPHDTNFFYISTEKGVIHHHDIRQAPASPQASKPVWKLQAHDDAVSSFDINPLVPGFLASGSADKEVKLWNVQAHGPSMVVSRNLDVGKVFSTVFAPDQEVGFRLAVAGSKGTVHVWDTSTNAAVRRAFVGRIGGQFNHEVTERLVWVQEEDDSSESEEEGEGGERAHDGQGGWESMDEG